MEPNVCDTKHPLEEDGDFDVVSEREIADWREKLNKRFGIGTGRLEAIEEPRDQHTDKEPDDGLG